MRRLCLTAAVVLALTPALALASGACPPGLPPQIKCGGPDMADITAGTYKLDDSHAGIIAQVPHIGYSRSIFRFDKLAGTLDWDPVDLSKAKLNVTVETASIATNVPGFAAKIAGDEMLKSKAFPTATFVSDGFRRTDATHGKVDGQFTLMGKTTPLTFNVALVGAGAGFGHPRLGVTATTSLKPTDYGLAPMFGAAIDLVIDVEFEKTS
ncbi:MAG: polyisoprenoid-binding protein [Phenylobacterium zucineum]|nr:MAG: polyisoprenoid-binding protein [Phenylobacterium zucineum]